MLTLAALTLSLATATAPALNDPGAAPAAMNAPVQQAQASGDAVPGAAGIAEAAPSIFANGASAALAHPAQTVGTPNIGTQTNSVGMQTNSESHGFPTGSILPLLGFAVCAAAALVFAKKKQQQALPKMLQIVETHSLGGRRSLIVARIAGETVLLGASEGGLTLLLARPGETVGQQELAAAMAPRAEEQQETAPEKSPLNTAMNTALNTSWLGRLRLARTPEDNEPEPSFEELLAQDAAARTQKVRAARPAPQPEPAVLRKPIDPDAESAEDQELRRKLSQGRSGRIA